MSELDAQRVGHVLPLYKYKEINIINAFPARRNKKLLNNFNCETFTTKFNGNIFNYSFFCCNFMEFLLQEVLESISMKIYTYSYVSKMKRSETDLCTTELIYNMSVVYNVFFQPKFKTSSINLQPLQRQITNPMGVIGSSGIGPTYATEHRFLLPLLSCSLPGFQTNWPLPLRLANFQSCFPKKIRYFAVSFQMQIPFTCSGTRYICIVKKSRSTGSKV